MNDKEKIQALIVALEDAIGMVTVSSHNNYGERVSEILELIKEVKNEQ